MFIFTYKKLTLTEVMSHCTCESGEIVFPQGEIGGLVHAHKGSFIYILKFCQAQAKTFSRMRTENTLRQHRVQASEKLYEINKNTIIFE